MHMIWTAFSCNQHRKKWIPRIFPWKTEKNVVENARLNVEVNLTSQTKWYLYQLLFAANRHSLEWIPSFLWHKFYLFSLFFCIQMPSSSSFSTCCYFVYFPTRLHTHFVLVRVASHSYNRQTLKYSIFLFSFGAFKSLSSILCKWIISFIASCSVYALFSHFSKICVLYDLVHALRPPI